MAGVFLKKHGGPWKFAVLEKSPPHAPARIHLSGEGSWEVGTPDIRTGSQAKYLCETLTSQDQRQKSPEPFVLSAPDAGPTSTSDAPCAADNSTTMGPGASAGTLSRTALIDAIARADSNWKPCSPAVRPTATANVGR